MALSRLPAAQLREMRESFQMLDRDNDGFVDIEDVKDMLGQIGGFQLSSVNRDNADDFMSRRNAISVHAIELLPSRPGQQQQCREPFIIP